jgi:hypothetical protein
LLGTPAARRREGSHGTKSVLCAGLETPSCLLAMAVSVVAFCVGVFLLATRQIVLHKLLLPLAVSIYSSDGIVEGSGMNQFNLFLRTSVLFSLFIGSLALGYALLWRYFSVHLASGGSTVRPSSILPASGFEICFLSATLIIALIFRSHDTILTRRLTYDEIFSSLYFINVESLWKTISSYISFNNHVAYAVLARSSQAIFGQQEWALRLPALLLGLASIVSVWIFARHFFGRDLAVLAGHRVSNFSGSYYLEHRRAWILGHDSLYNDSKLSVFTSAELRLFPRRLLVYASERYGNLLSSLCYFRNRCSDFIRYLSCDKKMR